MYTNKTILGGHDQTVNGVVADKARTVFFTPSRGAFLGLVRINAFGLADVLNVPNDLRMSQSKRDQARPLVNAIYTKWYEKFGGNRTALAEVIAKGAKERAFGFNIPIVKNFKWVQKLKAAGAIGNVPSNQIGIGVDPATDTAAATTGALPILVEIGGILASLATIIQIFKKPNEVSTGDNRIIDNSGNTPPPPPTEDTAGYGLIGAAVLAALYFGTQSKTPTKRRRTVKK